MAWQGQDLLKAARAGDIDEVQRIVAEDPQSVFENSYDEKRTALLVAVAWNRLSVVRWMLVNSDTNINHRDLYGCTPFSIATSCGFSEIVEALLEYGVDTAVQSPFGLLMRSSGRVERAQVLCLHIAIEHGIDINHPFNAFGDTPLMEAMMLRRTTAAHLLLHIGGGDAYHVNNTGKSVLQCADGRMIQFLCRYYESDERYCEVD